MPVPVRIAYRPKNRSTGLAGSLTSPTTEAADDSGVVVGGGVPATSPTAKGGSIVGLRATKFSTSRPSSNLSSLQSSDSTDQPAVAGVPKPKPLPKPRPWSIVGVDRKSGEVTSVIKTTADAANSDATPEHDSSKSQATATTQAPKATARTTTSTTSSSMVPPVAAARKSSVRDLINNMNKAGGDKGDKSAETTPTADVFRRKGNSLPRGTTPPAAAAEDKSATAIGGGGGGGSSSSPRVAAKAAECTSDDPRILKLDDDFAYDEVLDV